MTRSVGHPILTYPWVEAVTMATFPSNFLDFSRGCVEEKVRVMVKTDVPILLSNVVSAQNLAHEGKVLDKNI